MLPMKPATKRLAGVLVELLGRPNLSEDAGAEHGDAVRHGERIHLVVGDHDHRGA